MNFTLNAIFSFSIAFGAVIGGIRFRKIDATFFPFLFLIWIGLANEMISIAAVYANRSNALNYNIYMLAEALLICWQFKKWGLFKNQKSLYFLIQFLFVITWGIENLFLFSIYNFSSYFIIVHSFVIVLMSISIMNNLIVNEGGNLLRNSTFLICMGMVLYFTYSVLTETFCIYGLNQSKSFRIRIYEILSFINLFANFIYALAILWIPMKPRYTLQF